MLTDEQILYDALKRYTLQRKNFAKLVKEGKHVLPEGRMPTQDDIDDAIAMLNRCEELTARAKECVVASKAEPSRIITLN